MSRRRRRERTSRQPQPQPTSRPRFERTSRQPPQVSPAVTATRAEKKLAQARFFLDQLDQASRAFNPFRFDRLDPLESFWSAALSAAQSARLVLRAAIGKRAFGELEFDWYNALPNDVERSHYHEMMDMRDDDVHYNQTAWAGMATDTPERSQAPHSYIFGSDGTVEMENPGGQIVSAPVLRATTALYIRREGRDVPAVEAGKEFIGQLRSLIAFVNEHVNAS